jgi:hypothetical protein
VLAEPGNFSKQLFRFPPFFVHALSAYANPTTPPTPIH